MIEFEPSDEDDEYLDEEDDDEDDTPPTLDAKSMLHVMREQCSTCIFRPGNKMQLREGRMRDLTQQTDMADGNVICHQTLDQEVGALCAGSVERRPGQMFRIAERTHGVLYVETEAVKACRWSYANSMSFAYCETHSDYHRSFITPPTVCPTAERLKQQ
jgi:hypothetical protein